MKTIKPNQRLGDLTKEDINFPKHLTPEIIHCALFIHNAKDDKELRTRIEYCAKQIGDEAMSFALHLLVLPQLQQIVIKSNDYQDWLEQKNKKLH